MNHQLEKSARRLILSQCVLGAAAGGVGPWDSCVDQLLLAEPAANRAPGSSRWVWLALHGRAEGCGGGQGKAARVTFADQGEGRGVQGRARRKRQMSGWRLDSGELDTRWPHGLSFPLQSAWHLASS